jgi:hypothetical protein
MARSLEKLKILYQRKIIAKLKFPFRGKGV